MEDESRLPKAGQIYQHYKGKQYRVIGTARHTESLEPVVVYEALYEGNAMWVRPVSMWGEGVVAVDGGIVERFKLIK